MIFKFRFLSGEKDDFVRDFEAASNQTFYDLHLAIQKNCRYDTSQIASFFLCTSDWEKETEITLFEITEQTGNVTLSMDKAVLADHIKGFKQRLLYVFDIFNERAFFIEVLGVREYDQSGSYPRCTLSESSPPVQILADVTLHEQESKEQLDEEESFEGEDEPIEE